MMSLHRLLSTGSSRVKGKTTLLVRTFSNYAETASTESKGNLAFLVFPAITFCLGTWQVKRLKWKRELIAKLESRTSSEPTELPDNLLDPVVLSQMEYRRVRVSGKFDFDEEILLGPRSKNEGNSAGGGLISRPKTGYQVITPFVLSTGERILINRGWIPKNATDPKSRISGNISETVTVTGHVRKGEKRPQFAPKVADGSRIWNYCDAEGISQILKTKPILLEADASCTVEGGPIGGQTRVQLRNEHMQYIITWYSLTAALLVMIYYMRRQPSAAVSSVRR